MATRQKEFNMKPKLLLKSVRVVPVTLRISSTIKNSIVSVFSKHGHPFIQRIILHARLMLTHPLEYMYVFQIPATDTFNMKPFDANAYVVGNRLMRIIRQKNPDLNLFLVGSVGLKIDGQNDIDILIECPYTLFSKKIPELTQLFGVPKSIKKSFVKWEISYQNYKVEMFMSDKTNRAFRGYKNIFTVLGKKDVLLQYLKLKYESRGLTLRDFERKRILFLQYHLKKYGYA